jgi:Fe-S-cluster containining protein
MLEAKVKEIESVFAELDAQIANFQGWSGLHCKQGCGKCCFKPDIEATILEFLPLALSLYRRGQAEEWRERLVNGSSDICEILNPTQAGAGLCTEYGHRGLICRLFGYSARTNKHNQKELVTCQVIKAEQTEGYTSTVTRITSGGQVPVMNDFYMRLHSIDADLTRNFFPINTAIRKAIEVVLHHFAYRTDEGEANEGGTTD